MLILFLIGVCQALTFAGTLSYISMMPEKYMALNSMGIGFAGLLSFLLNGILLLCFDEENEYERVIVYYAICFILLSGVSAMYFIERKNEYA